MQLWFIEALQYMAIPMFNYLVRDPTPIYVLVVINIYYAAV